MRSEELKAEIKGIIDHLPEDALLKVSVYVKDIVRAQESARFKEHIKIILEEDKELLKRLANS